MLNSDFFHFKESYIKDILLPNEAPWTTLFHLEKRLIEFIQDSHEAFTPTGVIIEHPQLVIIEIGALIEPGAKIIGPCFIGKGAKVAHSAYIRPNSFIGRGSYVGHATEIKGSVLLDGAKASHLNYVGDSILGKNVNLGAGVKLANKRFDENEVIVYYSGEKILTGCKKLGAFIGDDVKVGCNVVTNPGTCVFPGVRLKPGVVYGGRVK